MFLWDQAVQGFGHGTIPSLSPDERLNEYGVCTTPHNEPAKRIGYRIELNSFLIFLVIGSMIEANRHMEVVEGSPALDENKIGNLE
jgi:hypothetical protein